jgi:hypothetical protein
MQERNAFRMSATDGELDPLEVFRLNDESFLADNDIRSEIHIASGSGTVHYPSIVVMGGKSFAAQNHMKIRVSYGAPLPPEVPPAEPDQIPTMICEKNEARRELIKLAQRIDELLLGGEWWLPIHEASKRSGLGDDWRAVREWRENYNQAIRARYNKEIRPQVIDTYERARVRGFFDPELEEYYEGHILVVAEKLPDLLRRAASKP